MKTIIIIVLLIDAIMGIKIIASMCRAKFRSSVYANETHYARLGFLVTFHVLIFIVGIVVYGINMSVQARL